MTKFRPCIDLHDGHVKQIVGSTLRDDAQSKSTPKENFVAKHPAEWFAAKYQQDGLVGGHVIKLGPGNDEAAKSSLNAYPGGLQIGGGINLDNAAEWLDAGASHVIVTSWLFDAAGKFQNDRLDQLVAKLGKSRIVIDLSCKRNGDGWTVAMNRWQTLTNLQIDNATLERLADRCDQFLIHAADVEGLCQGIDQDLVQLMGDWAKIPMTYAGGVATMDDVDLLDRLSNGKIDVTVGSALDLFGGTGVKYQDLVDRA
jgi:phosphoribosylformimino-5-aminoimidazole carboxamide ribotide isomerase